MSAAIFAAGCANGSEPQPGGAPDLKAPTGVTTQADTTATGGDPSDRAYNKIPKPRWVAPGSATGASGGGSGTSTPTAAWQPLTNQPSFYAGNALLLTDGSVMVQDYTSSNWWKLVPDANGSYVNGTWTQLAPAPNGYQPLWYASAVLPDGRVIVEGGEYQAFAYAWENTGAIYDPKADRWTSIAPPSGWQTIGDAQSVVLPDGRFYLANSWTTDAAVLDPKTLTWTAFGSGKADGNDEEGWTLLPNGNLLTVDANNLADLRHTEVFSPRTGLWASGGDSPVQLADTNADNSGSHELGPVLLRADGSVFAVGATGHSAIYHPRSGRWEAGPDLPNIPGQGQLDVADGPSVQLPNGHVLVSSSPGLFQVPVHLLDFDGRSFTEIQGPPGLPQDTSYATTFLLLPSGQVLFTDFSNDIEIYTPPGHADCDAAPVIADDDDLRRLHPGQTYSLSGWQLDGLSQGSVYGDDLQNATNYPIVRITNHATKHVVYARTHDRSYAGVAPGAWSSTSFDVPAGIDPGGADLVVIANGIASEPVEVHVQGAVQQCE